MKIIRELTVKNDLGLHTVPSTHILRILSPVDSTVMFTYQGATINAKSLTSLLALCAKKGAKIMAEIDGIDAEETMHKLEIAFNNKFGEKNEY